MGIVIGRTSLKKRKGGDITIAAQPLTVNGNVRLFRIRYKWHIIINNHINLIDEGYIIRLVKDIL